MDNFNGRYTTNEKITEDQKKPEKEQIEKGKTIITNEAYAVGEVVEQLMFKLESLRGLLVK
jgi:hypothetical protein